MSDILIKNMKMPESCHDCCLTDGWNCYTSLEYKDNEAYCDSKTKPDWCPLIEVPTPHGDLIDRDALDICRREQQAWQDYEHNPDNEYLEGVKDGLHEASKQISTAMTIIEAEDGT